MTRVTAYVKYLSNSNQIVMFIEPYPELLMVDLLYLSKEERVKLISITHISDLQILMLFS